MADKLTKKALAEQRKRLKVKLWRERAKPASFWVTNDVMIPVAETEYTLPLPAGVVRVPGCDYCGKPIIISRRCVMHEWLIRRGRLPIATQYKIMREYNCVLLHVDCHAQYETTRECKLRCARAQYKRYGRDTIVEWVQGLGLRQHVEVPTEEEVQNVV